MAAAYIYDIAQNHPFIDGNKRTALATGLIFLDINNIEIDDPNEELYAMMIDIASRKIKKDGISNILKKIIKN